MCSDSLAPSLGDRYLKPVTALSCSALPFLVPPIFSVFEGTWPLLCALTVCRPNDGPNCGCILQTTPVSDFTCLWSPAESAQLYICALGETVR